MYDVIIVGMGPAGMTSAVYTARKKMSTLICGKVYGGQLSWTAGVENYTGFQYIPGPKLIKKFEEHVNNYPVEQRNLDVLKIEKKGENFLVTGEDQQQFSAKTIIVATGKSPRRLKVPGEEEFTGRGVGYCTVCDGPLFAGLKVAVVGGGNSALGAVADLIKIASHVYVISPEEWIADPVIVDKVKESPVLTKMVGYQVISINGDNIVKSVTVKRVDSGEEKEVELEGVFIHIGSEAGTGFVKGFLELNQQNEIMVDCNCRTSVPGVFAAGDATSVEEKQVIVAAGDGAKAALGAYKYLLNHSAF